MRRVPGGGCGVVTALRVSPCGQVVAAVHAGGAVRVWALADLAPEGAADPSPLRTIPGSAGVQMEWRPDPEGGDTVDCLLVAPPGEERTGRAAARGGAQGGALSTTLSDASLEGVACASWAPGGDALALGRGGELQLATPGLEVFFSRDLEADARALEDDLEGGEPWRVESVAWLRRGAVLATCLTYPLAGGGADSDSEAEAEERCAAFIVRWSGFEEVGSGAPPRGVEVFRLDDYLVCGSIEASATPAGAGPYLRCAEVAGWGLHAVAHRKSSDCHVAIVRGGAAEAEAPPAVWELLEDEAVDPDKLQAKVPLTSEDEDNFVVGLDVDYTCHQATVRDPTNPGRYLPAGPVLCLLTSDARLLLYSLAQSVPDSDIGGLYPPGFIEPADPSVPPPSPGILKVLSRDPAGGEAPPEQEAPRTCPSLPSDDTDEGSDWEDTDEELNRRLDEADESSDAAEEGEGETSGRESSEEEVSSTPTPPREVALPSAAPFGGPAFVGGGAAAPFGGPAFVGGGAAAPFGGAAAVQTELSQWPSFGGLTLSAAPAQPAAPAVAADAQQFTFSAGPVAGVKGGSPAQEERPPQLHPQPPSEQEESPLRPKIGASKLEAANPLPPLKVDLPTLSKLEGISAPMQLVQEDFMAAVEEVCTLQADLERRVEALPLDAVQALSKEVEHLSSRGIKALSTLRGYRQEAHNLLEEHKETGRNSSYLKERYKSEDEKSAAEQLDPHLAAQQTRLAAEARRLDTHLTSLEGLLRGMELENVRKNIVGGDENSQANVPSFLRHQKSSGEALLAKVQKQHTLAISQNAVLKGLQGELEKLQSTMPEDDGAADAMEASSEDSDSDSLEESSELDSELSLEALAKSPWTGKSISVMTEHVLRHGSTPRISKANAPGDARATLASITKSKGGGLPVFGQATPPPVKAFTPALPTMPESSSFTGLSAAAQPPVPQKADVAKSQAAFSLALGGSSAKPEAPLATFSNAGQAQTTFCLGPAASDQAKSAGPAGAGSGGFANLGIKKSFGGPATTSPSPFGKPASGSAGSSPQASTGAAETTGIPGFGQSSSPKALGGFESSNPGGAQATTGAPGFGQPAGSSAFGQSSSIGVSSPLFSSAPAAAGSAPGFGGSTGAGFAAFSKGSPSGGFGAAAKTASPGSGGVFGASTQPPAGAFGSAPVPQGSGGFGAAPPAGGAGAGFGGGAQAPAFGSSPVSTFGSGQPAATGFGAAANVGAGAFGQAAVGAAQGFGSAAPPGSGGFGGTFGGVQSAGGGGFGAPAAASGGFNVPPPAGGGGFGQAAGGFGAQSQSSPFGSSTGGGFGSSTGSGSAGGSSGMWSARK